MNIIELSAQPTDMEVHVETEQSVVVYQGARRVDLVEHEQFHVESFELDEAMGHVTMGADLALLWDDDKYDVYRLHPETGELVEYRLHNPAIGMHLAPTEDFAIARTRAEDGGGDVYDQANGLEILNLANEDARPFLLEGRAIDLAWTVGDATLQALVLQDGVDYLFQYDLYTGAQLEIELEAPPKSIGSMPEGGFFITHDVGAGLVSFLDDDGSITSVAGFATLGLLDTVELSFEEE